MESVAFELGLYNAEHPKKPEWVVVCEAPIKDLYSDHPELTDEHGQPMTWYRAIELFETEDFGAQQVTLNSNGMLSPEANAHNSKLSDDKQSRSDERIAAVISLRPPKSWLT